MKRSSEDRNFIKNELAATEYHQKLMSSYLKEIGIQLGFTLAKDISI